jgi:hypothetical protein
LWKRVQKVQPLAGSMLSYSTVSEEKSFHSLHYCSKAQSSLSLR